jgi:phage replication-related protein YjqB (UPF0714/DUF867 family)
MIDTFRTFEELRAQMSEGSDYQVTTKNTGSPYLIMAIHGGEIEPFTSDIAKAIAGEEYSLYAFEGVDKEKSPSLHIGSRYFDEPQAMDMVRSAEIVISIHGQRDKESEFVMVGGLCEELVKKITEHLQAIDIPIQPFERDFYPRNADNICNKGMSGRGVELEISRKLRDALREDGGMYRLFINAIRHAIEENQ